jgi:hypothetical protein
MADLNLKAIVEILVKGLQDLQVLGDTFVETAEKASALIPVGEVIEGLGPLSQEAARDIEAAFAALGGRSITAIHEEIGEVQQGLSDAARQAAETGKGFELLSDSERRAAQRLAELNAELRSPATRSFNDNLATLVTTTGSVGRAFDDLVGTGTTDLKSLDAAIKVLGSRSLQEVTAEIGRVKAALESIKGSGASFDEIAKAEALATQKLEELNSELLAIGDNAATSASSVNRAFSSIASIAEVEQAIRDVDAALQTIKDGEVGFRALAAAEELAAQKLVGLNDRLRELKQQAEASQQALNNAFSILGGRTTQQITEQINAIKKALDDVRASGASFEEVARAEALAEARLRSLNAELRNPAPRSFSEAMDNIAGKLRNLDLAGATKGFSELVGSIGNIAAFTVAGAAVTAITSAISKLVSTVDEAAKYAARVDTLAISLDVVARNAGYSKAQLDPLEAQFKKIGITTEATRQSLLQMIQAGINITGLTDAVTKSGESLTVAGELARRAQDLAVVSGENSSQTLQRLTLNIQQMDTMGLKFMGLIVNREAAMDRYAQKLGTVASALTPTQQKQAFLNATMDEARKLDGAYESSLESVGKMLGSLQRYQDEYTYSLGKNFQPALKEIVLAYTEFLSRGQKVIEYFNTTTNTANDLGEAIRPVVLAIKDLVLAAQAVSLDVFVNAVPVLRDLGAIFETLYQGVKSAGEALVSFFDDGTEESRALMASLDPIRIFFLGLRTIIAAVSDGVTVLVGGMQLVASKAQEGLAALTRVRAEATRPFNSAAADALVKVAEGYERSSKVLAEAGDRNVKKLMEGEGALGRLVNEYGKVDEKANAAGKTASAFSSIISNLAQAQRDGTASTAALSAGYNGLTSALSEAVQNGQLSRKEFGELTRQLEAIPGNFASRFSEAAAAANISLSQLKGDLSQSTATALNYLSLLIEGAATKDEETIKKMGSTLATIGQDVSNVYAKLLGEAKTLSDLVAIEEKLVDARAEGIISVEQYGDAIEATSVKFLKLFDASLKTAQTRDDFDKLAQTVGKLGEAGAISGTVVVESLKKIAAEAGTKLDLDTVQSILEKLGKQGVLSGSEVTKGLQSISAEARTSASEIKRLSDQTVALADQGVKLASARLNITQSEVAVAKSRVDLWVAENKYAQSGNELDQLGVQIARLDLQVAQQQLELSRIRYQEEVAAKDVLIAKQKVLNATTALERDASNEALQQAAAAAEQQAAAQELTVNRLRVQADRQQEVLLATQQQQVVTKGVYDQLKTVQTALDASAKSGLNLSNSLGSAYGNSERMARSVQGAGASFGQLSSSGSTTLAVLGNLDRASFSFGNTASAAASRVSSSFGSLGSVQGDNVRRYGELYDRSSEWAAGSSGDASRVAVSMQAVGSSADGVKTSFGDAASASSIWSQTASSGGQEVERVLDNLFSSTETIVSGFSAMSGSSDTWATNTVSNINRVSSAAASLSATLSRVQSQTGGITGIRGSGVGTSNAPPGYVETERYGTIPVSQAQQIYNNLTPEQIQGLGGGGYGMASGDYVALRNAAMGGTGLTNTIQQSYDQNNVRTAGGFQLPQPKGGGGWTFIPDQRAYGGVSPQTAMKGQYTSGSWQGKAGMVVNGVGVWVRTDGMNVNGTSVLGSQGGGGPFGGTAGGNGWGNAGWGATGTSDAGGSGLGSSGFPEGWGTPGYGFPAGWPVPAPAPSPSPAPAPVGQPGGTTSLTQPSGYPGAVDSLQLSEFINSLLSIPTPVPQSSIGGGSVQSTASPSRVIEVRLSGDNGRAATLTAPESSAANIEALLQQLQQAGLAASIVPGG